MEDLVVLPFCDAWTRMSYDEAKRSASARTLFTKYEFQELARLMERAKEQVDMDFSCKRMIIIEALKIAAEHAPGAGTLK